MTDSNVIGTTANDIFPNLPKIIVDVHRLLLDGVSSKSEQDEILLADRIVYNKWKCIPWYEGKDEVGGFVVYIKEITKRVKLARTFG